MHLSSFCKTVGLAAIFFKLNAVVAAPAACSRLCKPRHFSRQDNSNDVSSNTTAAAANSSTANSDSLKTWWHDKAEKNTDSPVANDAVRQSHKYNVQIASSSDPNTFYDSFVYMTIPRNGNGKICKPGDFGSICDTDDQITIEADIGVNMAWSQFLYGEDAIVKITRTDGGSVDASNVKIKPSVLGFDVSSSNDATLITVPYNENGYRFSVEFQDDLWEYRGRGGDTEQYVQNKNPSGINYVSSYDDSMPVVGVEPLNALMIFASAFPASDLVPGDDDDAYRPEPGLVTGLDSVSQRVLYFEAGVYYMTGSAHGILSDSIEWVYIAPGAYVKGAIEYHSQSTQLKASGFGVLSGEQYVYQANTAQGYTNIKSDDTSLKMWRGHSADGMTWTMHGLTTNSPPFNSMDFYGNMDTFSVQVSDYKQVGAFFGQTDGMQSYPNSNVHDVFYHVGDDGIKTYYSNVQISNMIVWKTNNAPIVQYGWYARDVSNVVVDNVDVIHTRYIKNSVQYPRALVASAASYVNDDSSTVADITKHLTNYRVTNWRTEGISPGLLGINPLVNIDDMLFENIHIDQFGDPSTGVGTSTFTVFTDGKHGDQPICLGCNSDNHIGLTIKDFYVSGEKITIEGDNWQSNKTGRLNIDSSYWGNWTAI